MADVIIRGMEMPEFCDECGCKRRTQRGACCGILGKPLKTSRNYKRDDDCPLLPLPEGHGDLVDVKELLNDKEGLRLFKGDFRLAFDRIIERANTIVPAEGGNADVPKAD